LAGLAQRLGRRSTRGFAWDELAAAEKTILSRMVRYEDAAVKSSGGKRDRKIREPLIGARYLCSDRRVCRIAVRMRDVSSAFAQTRSCSRNSVTVVSRLCGRTISAGRVPPGGCILDTTETAHRHPPYSRASSGCRAGFHSHHRYRPARGGRPAGAFELRAREAGFLACRT